MSTQTPKATPAAQADDPLAPIAIPAQPAFTEDVADIGDARLWYTDTGGAGIPVVLLHPASGSALVWSYQRPALVAAGFRVIAYSRRSCFGSSPIDKGNPGIRCERPACFRRSPGAREIPHRGLRRRRQRRRRFLVYLSQRLAASWSQAIRSAFQIGGSRRISARIRPEEWGRLPRWFRELGPSYRAANDEGVKTWIDLAHRGAAPEGARQKPARKVTEDMLATMRTPTLLMTGAADTSTPPAMLRMVARVIPNCAIFMVAECGHSAYWERPDIFNAVVTEFLKRH